MKSIPIFFALDNNYVKFFTVSLLSLKENRAKNKKYDIHILHTKIDDDKKAVIKSMEEKNFHIEFNDVKNELEKVSSSLQTRDYYTISTYYRIFIPTLFPNLDKALYLDSDTIINYDISQLYETKLNKKLIGGVSDGAVGVNSTFAEYTEKALGIKPQHYFNAGIIVMNLKEMRKQDFLKKFLLLSSLYKFSVAQDQDYLNVLCAGKTVMINGEWNTMPIGENVKKPKLIHYNLTLKPWHYRGIRYEEYFWNYARKTEFYNQLLALREEYDEKSVERDKLCEKSLVELCCSEINNEKNYYKVYGKLF